MNLVQAQTLITRVQQDVNAEGLGGLLGAGAGGEIMDRLNRAKREFLDEMRGWGGQYFRHRTTISTVNGTSIYQLPSECISITFVLAYLTPTQFTICKPFTDDMRPMFATLLGTGWILGEPIYYQMDDTSGGQQSIEFLPIPTGQFSLTIGYQYSPADFVNLTDQMEDVNGWSEFMVARAAEGCATKMQRFDLADRMGAKAARELDRLRRMAPLRDMGSAEVVRDVTRTAPAGFWEEFDG